MPEDAFSRALTKARQIRITLIGRKSGRMITLPVWFVHVEDTLWLLPVHGRQTQWYQNVQKNPTITIKVGKEERTVRARLLKSPSAIRKVVESFRKKFTPEIITKLYPGPLNAAIKLNISSDA